MPAVEGNEKFQFVRRVGKLDGLFFWSDLKTGEAAVHLLAGDVARDIFALVGTGRRDHLGGGHRYQW